MAPKSRKKVTIEETPLFLPTEPVEEPVPPEPEIKPKTRKGRQTKKEEKSTEHVIVQLPIPQEKLEDIIRQNAYTEGIVLQDNREPLPYSSVDHFDNVHDCVSDIGHTVDSKNTENCIKDMHPSLTTRQACYWCCHEIGPFKYGMPVSYDTVHQSFHQYGLFCSLECTAAYNFSTNMGSDRMWEIHSWIQWMAQKMGYDTPIRPAPSRYLLKMFNGPLEIQEFREMHKNYLKTYVMNMPPLIHVQGQMETINTSYLNQKMGNISTTSQEPMEKMKLSRKKAVVDMKKTLDAKMNLTVKPVQEVA